mgnify:CR=1 FL=1|nr:MAG TPA: hypothetical protein [Caudoviricetes sp.]
MNEINENVTHVTNAVENAVTHCVAATDITETAVTSAKNLTLGGIGLGIGASALIGGLIYGGIKLYKLIDRKNKERKNKKVVEIDDCDVIDGECDEVK